jgi:hypothetical protein
VPDALVLAVAAAVAYGPGLALLTALPFGTGLRPGLVRIALAPAASVAVAGVTATLLAPTGLRYGAIPVLVVTAALAGVAVVRRRRGTRQADGRRPRDRYATTAGIGMIVAGAAFPVWAWLTGIGPLATPPQEHDMIVHVVQTAYIARSGHGAPWQLAPADLLTGAPVWFYPSGVHLLAAVTATLTGGAVVPAVNAQTVVLLAVALCTGVAALGAVAARRLGLGRDSALLVAGVAALVMGGLYRPGFHLMHDGGIFANAVALSLTPGVVAGVLALSERRARAGAAVGAAVAGVAWCHPSGAVSIAVTAGAWWVGELVTWTSRAQLRRAVPGTAVAAGVAAVLLVPVVASGASQSARTAGWPPDTRPLPFVGALGETFGFPYAGFFDLGQTRSQAWVLALVVVGVGAVVALRRGLGPVAAYAAWSAVILGEWLSPGVGPDALVTRFYYHAMLRTWSHVSLLAPVLGGLGVVLAANRVAVLARRHAPLGTGRLALALACLAFVGYAAVPAAGYARVNELAVATRYRTPEFTRVGPDDRRAGDWLAARVRPGERVLNSPNDGSTYLYVDHGIPVVNIGTLGLTGLPYTYRLLQSFNTYPSDPDLRRELGELDVRWVYVDSDAPPIGSAGSPDDWAGAGGFRLAPGLTDLDGLPGLSAAFRSGSVTVYTLDLSALAPSTTGA